MADTTPPAPPYVVENRPGSGLATITDRRTGQVALWSRSLRGGSGRHSRRGRHTTCANCGREIVGPFYKPPQRPGPIAAYLCLACVEGAAAQRP